MSDPINVDALVDFARSVRDQDAYEPNPWDTGASYVLLMSASVEIEQLRADRAVLADRIERGLANGWPI